MDALRRNLGLVFTTRVYLACKLEQAGIEPPALQIADDLFYLLTTPYYKVSCIVCFSIHDAFIALRSLSCWKLKPS